MKNGEMEGTDEPWPKRASGAVCDTMRGGEVGNDLSQLRPRGPTRSRTHLVVLHPSGGVDEDDIEVVVTRCDAVMWFRGTEMEDTKMHGRKAM